MVSLKAIALCFSVVLATTSANVHAQAPTISRNLRVQHQSDTPHTHADANGATTTNVNISPGTINTNVNITPGTSTTTVQSVPAAAVAAPPPLLPVPAPAAVAVRPAPAPQSPSVGGGLDFGSLLGGGGGNPLTGIATMAHGAHGALLGHTNTAPSSFMQSQKGGGR